jgi:hypothetical protein
MIAGLPKPTLEDARELGRTLDMLRQIFAIIRPLDLEGRQRIILAAAALLGLVIEDHVDKPSGNR